MSYRNKILIICGFLLLPLAYSAYFFNDSNKQNIQNITLTQKNLDFNHELYKTLIIAEDFQNSHLQYFFDSNSLKSQENEILNQAHSKLILFLTKEKAEEFERCLKAAKEAFKAENRELFEEKMSLYKAKLLESLVWIKQEYQLSKEVGFSEIVYVLNVELPILSLLTIELKAVKEKHELIKVAELQMSSKKTDLMLKGTVSYENHFEEINLLHQAALTKYLQALEKKDKPAVLAIQEKVLSLQLSLYNTLQEFLKESLAQELALIHKTEMKLLYILLSFIFMGLYLFIAAYLSMKLSIKKFSDTTLEIARGNLNARVNINNKDEMGTLANTFNDMIDNLEYQYQLLREFKSVVDRSAIVLKTDVNGIITYVNEAYENISLYSKKELLGSSHRLIHSDNTRSQEIKELWEHILEKKVYKTIFENIAKNGKSFFVESTIVPLLNRDGEIEEFIAIMFDITPLYKQKEKLQSQVYKDELTALPNRHKLIQDIHVTQEAKLIVLNMDSFKEINAVYGESVGDLTLQKMAVEIKNVLKSRHLQLYKLCADEFAILAGKEISVEYFREDVTMLSHYLSHTKLQCNEHEVHVRLSIGAAIASKHNERPLLSMASMALNGTKRQTRSYAFYNDISTPAKNLEKNHQIIEMIDRAIKEDKVYCYYQGIVNAKTGEIQRYEALMRLEDEEGKMISPVSFVDLAKRSRYYQKLTQKVVQEAVYTFLKRTESVSINLSIDDIIDDSTYAFILDVLRNCGCADRIIFELLETEEIEFNERVLDFTAQVKKLGCKIAIDDFGSGYSNYAYLLKLGVDILKIDASLIKDLDTNENSRLIVKSIIDIAHALGMKTVAEHIHTKEIAEMVKEMGADYLQGFYLHKPSQKLTP